MKNTSSLHKNGAYSKKNRADCECNQPDFYVWRPIRLIFTFLFIDELDADSTDEE